MAVTKVMRRAGALFALLCLLAAITSVQAQPEPSLTTPVFQQVDCPFTLAARSLCGTVSVPQDPEGGDASLTPVVLPVVILQSVHPNKSADPLIYIEGGPFAPAIQMLPVMLTRFAGLLETRDIIIYDQRGGGMSQPRLRCTPYADAVEYIQGDFFTPEFAARLAECHEAFASQGINPQHFTTSANAADVAALMEALHTAYGYEQFNLYGASYGTQIVLTVLRDHPARVRSAILDSTLPPEVRQFTDFAPGFEAAFNALAQTCAEDIVCGAAYPNLRDTYIATYAHLQAQPAEIGRLRYSGEHFAGDVMMKLASGAFSEVPAFVDTMARGDYAALRSGLEQLNAQTPLERLPGLEALSVICAYAGATTPQAVEAGAAQAHPAFRGTLPPFYGSNGYRLCEQWGAAADELLAPVISEVPVLVVGGQYDPLTPVSWAQQTAQGLSHSTVLTFAHTGHVGVFGSGCAQTLFRTFLSDLTTANADTACAAAVAAPSFTLSYQVTRPLAWAASALFTVVTLVATVWTVTMLARQPIALRASLRRVGWMMPVFSLLAMLFIANTAFAVNNALGVVAFVVPLITGLQAAMVFAPDDEPALEIQLAAPRPASMLILERFGAVLLVNVGVALAGILLFDNRTTDPVVVLLGWIPSAIFLGGMGLLLTVRLRVVLFGVVFTGLVWGIFAFFGDAFLPGAIQARFPLNVVQSVLWMFHINLTVADSPDYVLNRVIVLGAGILLSMLAIREVRSEESVLMAVTNRRRRAGTGADKPAPLRTNLKLTPAAVHVQPLAQIVGMALYEFRMHWRRRAFKVITLTMVLGSAALVLSVGGNLNTLVPSLPSPESLSSDQAAMMSGLALTGLSSTFLMVTLIFIVPVLVSDTVPIDRQQHVDDLLGSLPVPRWVYLAGKVGGVWLASLFSVGAAVMVLLGLWVLRVGMLNPLPILDMLVSGALPALLFSSGSAVLVGATQPSRRRAVLAVIGYLLLPPFLLSASPLSIQPVIAFVVPGWLDVLMHYSFTPMEALFSFPLVTPPFGLTNIELLTVAVGGLVQMVIISFAVYGLWRARQA